MRDVIRKLVKINQNYLSAIKSASFGTMCINLALAISKSEDKSFYVYMSFDERTDNTVLFSK